MTFDWKGTRKGKEANSSLEPLKGTSRANPL